MSDERTLPQRDSMNRRGFLTRLGVATGGAAIAAGLPRSRALAQPANFQLRASDPDPRYGGTLRFAIHSSPAHFDIHQSGTVANIGAQGPMYDNLIRRDPRDGQTIIPDLAWKWEIAPDGKTYTFFLRKGVQVPRRCRIHGR